mmetsp:Transcript_12429/g.17744  ORF Transcript_12429/g.17744 Transcript_12429/m.17744 type:complete len:1412 (+) Transcript_12429:314-4549(+)
MQSQGQQPPVHHNSQQQTNTHPYPSSHAVNAPNNAYPHPSTSTFTSTTNSATMSTTNNYAAQRAEQAAKDHQQRLANEQSRLLSSAIQRVRDACNQMRHAMNKEDLVMTLDRACVMLGELGDPNHRSPHPTNNSKHHHGHGGSSGGGYGPGGEHSHADTFVTPLSPKNYYELHMVALEELPNLEEFFLSLAGVSDQEEEDPEDSQAAAATAAQGGSGMNMNITNHNGNPEGTSNQVVDGNLMQNNMSPYSNPNPIPPVYPPTIGENVPSQYNNLNNHDTHNSPHHFHAQQTMPPVPMNHPAAPFPNNQDQPPPPLYTVTQIYEAVRYCPRVVPRLYLQICAGSALIRSGEDTASHVMKTLIEDVKCVQCPIRGLFLRHYLLQAVRDKLPDEDPLLALAQQTQTQTQIQQQPHQQPSCSLEELNTTQDTITTMPQEEGEASSLSFRREMLEARAQEQYFESKQDSSHLQEQKQEENIQHEKNDKEEIDDFKGDDHDTKQKDAFQNNSAMINQLNDLLGDSNADDLLTFGGEEDGMEKVEDIPMSAGVEEEQPTSSIFTETLAQSAQGKNIHNAQGNTTETQIPSLIQDHNTIAPEPSTSSANPEVLGTESENMPTVDPQNLDHDVAYNNHLKGIVKDSYTFVLANFVEMNKLWVRMRHLPTDNKTILPPSGFQSNFRTHSPQFQKQARKNRERERNELRVLVGTNLVRLSELEGVTSSIYGNILLPRILEQVVACRDPLAQAYLMDCLVQVFPDEFHVQTLEVLLGVCPKLRDRVNIRTILHNIMSRLRKYHSDALLLNDEEDENNVKSSVIVDAISIIEDCIERVFEARGPNLTAREALRLHCALMEFSLDVFPEGGLDRVERSLGVCNQVLKRGVDNSSSGNIDYSSDGVTLDELGKLLSVPHEALGLDVLDSKHYAELLTYLPPEKRINVALTLLESMISEGRSVPDKDGLERVFAAISPLVNDDKNRLDKESKKKVEMLLTGLVHLFDHKDVDLAFEMLVISTKKFSTGGNEMIINLFPPLVFCALKLSERVFAVEYPLDLQLENKNIPDNNGKNLTQNSSKEVDASNNEVTTEQNVSDGEICQIKLSEDKESNDILSKEDDGAFGSGVSKQIIAELNNNVGDDIEKPLFEDLVETEEHDQLLTQENSHIMNVNCRKVFLYIQRTILMLKNSSPKDAYELCMQAAATSERFGLQLKDNNSKSLGDFDACAEFASITYEIVSQAFLVYESYYSVSNNSLLQQNAIVSAVNMLLNCGTLVKDEYNNLITKVTQYAARLVKKTAQCKMLLVCSHLFYCGHEDDKAGYQNPKRVLECLQRALKIADVCTTSSPGNAYLFVDILEKYIYFYERKNPVISDKFITGLVALVKEHMLNNQEMPSNAVSQFNQIIEYLQRKKNDTKSSDIFKSVKI